MSNPQEQSPPPRAFSQGVGLVFQIVGGLLFMASSFICCGSSLLSKDFATQTNLTHVGWHFSGDPVDQPSYSAQKAITISVFASVFFGLALAGIGLGLQAEHSGATGFAVAATSVATVFWLVQTLFAFTAMHSLGFGLLTLALAAVFGVACAFAAGAFREMRANPPPDRHEVLPSGYKIPYSHYHPDPPEVRLAAEIEQRRQRLAVQQKELEMLEEKLKRKLEENRKPEEPSS